MAQPGHRDESMSDEEPPLHFYLAQSKDTAETTPSAPSAPASALFDQSGQPQLKVEEKGNEDFARPTKKDNPNLNYHIPQFDTSGNFGESVIGASVFGSSMEPKPAPKRNTRIRNEEEDENEPGARGSLQLERKYKDVAFGIAFLISFGVMLIIAIIVNVNGEATLKPIEDLVGDIAYVALSQSMTLIIGLCILGVICGAIMVFLFRFFIKITVWCTICLTPLILFICSIWAFLSAGTAQSDSNTAMIVLGVLTLLFSIGLVALIYFMKRKIDSTIAFLKLACDVMKARPTIPFVALFNSFGFLLFTAFWYWNFAWIYMIGHHETSDSGTEIVWVLDPSSYAVATFLVFMYIWSAAVLNYVQNFVISEITCQWYYHRHDFSAVSRDPTSRALRHAFTTSFGSICLASLVYSALSLCQFLLRQAMRFVPNRQSYTVTNCLFAVLETVNRMVDSVNKFALAYCALSGDGFCKATKVTFGIFRRNLLDRVSITAISHFVLSVWVVTISLFFSLSLFTYATNSLSSVYGWLVGLVTFLISYSILRFFADLILNISDTLFLCYAIDCDTNTALLGPQQTPNQAVHRTLDVIFHENENVVLYDEEENL